MKFSATETRLWITQVIMPVVAVSALVYTSNKEKIHAWVKKQKLKKYST